MIDRYTRPEMGALWTDAARMEAWRRVEVAACEAMDGPTEAELEAIRAATFTVEAVQERERVTDHDVAAFVDVLSASAGDAGRWIHFGLTSSDVLDTATALQLRAAGEIVMVGARELVAALAERAREHVDTVCVGRTHGVHAEPTTFGIKLAGFAMEAQRNVERLERAFAQVSVGADVRGRRHVLRNLAGLRAEGARTARPRARARFDPGRCARSPRRAAAGRRVGGCRARALRDRGPPPPAHRGSRGRGAVPRGQKGSSAMPHKRNPITTERITGLARVLRGYASTAVENVALWHERDISHSGAERVILPDSLILLDYMQSLAIRVVRGMVVHEHRMRENLDITCGALFSQRVLLALVAGGMTRDEAYRIVQEAAQRAWDERVPLRALLEARPELDLDLEAIFSLEPYTRYAREIVGRVAGP